MDDYSLVPVDHQPDFSNVSLVPVEHDPFSADGVAAPAQAQAAQPQSQQVQAQPQTQNQPQPVSLAQSQPAFPGSGKASSSVDFFNQLAAPERAESEGVADLVQNHPTAAKIVGAIGLGSALAPPLAIAGAEGLGLFGAGLGGSTIADGLPGSTVAGAGRLVANTAARQAIADAESTLPNGLTRIDFQRFAGFAKGLPASSEASTEATAEIISKLKEAGITSRSVAAFQKVYEGVARENPSNLSAVHRAALLANILRNFE